VARLDPALTNRDKSESDRLPSNKGPRAKSGLTLLVPDTSMNLAAVVLAMRGRGLRPVVTPLAENVLQIVTNWNPRAIVLQMGVPGWRALLEFVGRRSTPTVVIGNPQQLLQAEKLQAMSVGLVSPAEPAEIADAAELVTGPLEEAVLPGFIDFGDVSIDVRGRRVRVEGVEIELPPKEFEILMELALHPGEPVSSMNLIRKLWPATATTTLDDLHCRVSRLRALIGDRDRPQPLVGNRRGFGYVLNARLRIEPP
jgi:DNA-binding response OmpR family regulator